MAMDRTTCASKSRTRSTLFEFLRGLISRLLLLLPMGKGAARTLGLVFSIATLAVAAGVTVLHVTGADLAVQVPWIRAFGAWWALDVDGMGLAMVLMTAILTPLALLGWLAWRSRLGTLGLAVQLGYAAAFMLFARLDNDYWGMLVVPTLFVGLVFAPAALAALIDALRRPASLEPAPRSA